VFIEILFTVTKLWNYPRYPLTDDLLKKMCCIYTKEYHSTLRKNEIMTFSGKWIELETIMLNEISQTKKGKYHMFSFVCGIWT
jgi:hypothetical protein